MSCLFCVLGFRYWLITNICKVLLDRTTIWRLYIWGAVPLVIVVYTEKKYYCTCNVYGKFTHLMFGLLPDTAQLFVYGVYHCRLFAPWLWLLPWSWLCTFGAVALFVPYHYNLDVQPFSSFVVQTFFSDLVFCFVDESTILLCWLFTVSILVSILM